MNPMNLRPFAVLSLATVLLAGCVSSDVSNLTPRTLPASVSRSYPFEVTWDSKRRGVSSDDVKAYVMVDQVLYPMNRVPNTENRWEARVPLPEGKTYVPYKFKFDYTYPGVTSRFLQSEWSGEYRLVVSAQ
jgi:hypothetical protein